jgi:hypothetical protein
MSIDTRGLNDEQVKEQIIKKALDAYRDTLPSSLWSFPNPFLRTMLSVVYDMVHEAVSTHAADCRRGGGCPLREG